jgi:branched-chain amino acid aminotransferase
MLASLDGTVMDAADVLIPATDEGLLRGDGVFEVIRLYAGRPFALDDHLARMRRSADNLRLEIHTDLVRADIEALLAQAGEPDAALRVLWTRGGRRLAFVEQLKELPPTLALASVTFAPTRILDGVKSLSYAGNRLAGRLARERGADEALLVTPHGRVLEGPTCSFFCSLDGETLVTPPLEDHILDSITRRRLLGLTGAREAIVAADELGGVREAFMASTLREVHPVHAIDGATLPAAPGPLTEAAAAAMRGHVEQELGLPAARR